MSLDQPLTLALLALVPALLLLLWAVLPAARGYRRRRRVVRVVRGLGTEHLRNVLLPDGVDGQVQVDYVVLTPRALLVLDLRDYGGAIFAGAKLDAWSQVVGRRSYKFSNPLIDNDRRCAAVRAVAGNAAVVAGRVVFAGDAWFPKGVPERVSRLTDLPQDVAAMISGTVAGTAPDTEDALSPALREAWARLTACAQRSRTHAA